MIYDLNNIGSDIAFAHTGVKLTQAYDKDNAPLLNGSADNIVVMSYNVQDFKGINAQQAMQVEIINKYTPDIIGIQEFYNSNTVPAIAQAMLSGYNIERFNHLNYMAIASKGSITGKVNNDYTTQDPQDISQWNETRGYIKVYTQINGHTICFFNTHLCLTNTYKFSQMQELLNVVKAEDAEYKIVTGDFNVYSMSIDTEYDATWKLWLDNGFSISNGTIEAGFTGTYSPDSGADAEFITAPDNIIVSNNITINNVVYDRTKLSYLNGSKIDHIPMIAYLTLN